MEYGATDPYGTYQTKDNESPYEILLRLKSWQNEIRSTISVVNETLSGIHEQQTQILQNIDSIELNVLDIQSNASATQQQISNILVEVGNIELTVASNVTNLDLHTTEIANLQLTQSQITLNVANIDNRLGSAESSLIVNSQAIASKVSISQFNAPTITSLMVQDAYSFSWFAEQLSLNGLVSFNALQTNSGSTLIHGGNIMTGTMLLDRLYGNLFSIGNGQGGTALDIYALAGSHRVRSYDSAGFRIQSDSNLSLQAGINRQLTVYSLSKFWAERGLEVTGLGQFNNGVNVAGTMTATSFQTQSGQPLVDTLYLANMNYLTYSQMTNYIAGLDLTTVAWVNSQLRQKEIDIVAWANRTFVAK